MANVTIDKIDLLDFDTVHNKSRDQPKQTSQDAAKRRRMVLVEIYKMAIEASLRAIENGKTGLMNKYYSF